jgi:cytochrome c oxidase subunit III
MFSADGIRRGRPSRDHRGVQAVITDPLARERDLNSLSTVTLTVVIAIVTMTFGAMIGVFLLRSAVPRFWGHLNVPYLLWVTTALLITSSFAFEKARTLLTNGDQLGFNYFLKITTVLGLLFLAGQVGAWFQLIGTGTKLARNPHSWFLFLFTGLHGIHILVGLAGLGYLVVRTRQRVSGPRYLMYTRVVARAVAIYWHYLDFLWLVMFTLLLLWRQ